MLLDLVIALSFTCQGSAPLAELCSGNDSSTVCVSHYASIIPNGFFRPPNNSSLLPTAEPAFEQTLGANATAPSFELLSKAAFRVYDQKRGLPLLEAGAGNEIMFKTLDAVHDAPIYARETNELYFSRLSPGLLSQSVINLTASPPTLSNKTADPTLYSAEGGVFQKRPNILWRRRRKCFVRYPIRDVHLKCHFWRV
jgi:hypothetical protein